MEPILDGVEKADSLPTPRLKEPCNRHSDCDEADRIARERGTANMWGRATHCRAEDCTDCFGS